MAISLFGLAISSAVLEGQLVNGSFVSPFLPLNSTTASTAATTTTSSTNTTSNSLLATYYNQGAFASAAFFGFILVILYIGHLVSTFFDLVNDRQSQYQ